MTATIASAKAKYLQKTKVMPSNYNAGMSAFLGRDVSNSGPAQSFARSIGPAAVEKWERNLRNAFGG